MAAGPLEVRSEEGAEVCSVTRADWDGVVGRVRRTGRQGERCTVVEGPSNRCGDRDWQKVCCKEGVEGVG